LSLVVIYGQVWLLVVIYGQEWSLVVIYGQVWSLVGRNIGSKTRNRSDTCHYQWPLL